MRKMNKQKLQSIVTLFVLLLIVVFMSLSSDRFLTSVNLTNILRQVSLTVITASAATMVMITCGLDLSVGSVVAFSGVVAARMASTGTSLGISILVGVLAGTLIGAINGGLIIGTKIPPVIATLGTMYVARGLAYIMSGGSSIVNGLPDSFGFASDIHFGPFPLMVIIMAVVFIVFCILLNKTLLGKYTYAIGGNIETAKLSGINTDKIKLIIYTLVGTSAGLSGVLMASRLYSGDPNVGIGFEFDVIVAIVLGGTSLEGGEGRLEGTLVGALIVAVLANGMNLMGIDSFYQYVVQGIVLVFAVVLDLTLKGKGIKLETIKKSLSKNQSKTA